RGAGGVVAVGGALVLSQLRLGGKGVRVEAGRPVVPPFEGTEPGQLDPLLGAGRRRFAVQEGGQSFVQVGQAFALPYPQRGGERPARVLGAELVAAADGCQGCAQIALLSEGKAQVAVSLCEVRLDANGFALLRDGLIDPALFPQSFAEKGVGPGIIL